MILNVSYSWRGSKSNHFDAKTFNRETSALLPPAITYDEVATAPSSPTGKYQNTPPVKGIFPYLKHRNGM